MRRTISALYGWWFCAVIAAAPICGQPNLDRRTTIDVSAAAPADVYGSIARTLGCELSMSGDTRPLVTMRLINVTVRTALNALSESIGCRWMIDGNTLRVEPAGAGRMPGGGGVVGGVPGGVTGGVVGGVPGGVVGGVPGGVVGGVSGGVKGGVGGVDFKQRLERKTPAVFRFDGVPLRTVMDALGKVADLEVRLDEPEASQLVSIDLGDRTVMSALKAIGQQVGLNKAVVFAATAPGSNRKTLLKVGPAKKK